MIQKLQHNFDVIQYLVKDASFDQLIWRKDENSHSLQEILSQLSHVEMQHAQVQIPNLGSVVIDDRRRDNPSSCDKPAFESYAHYRHQTMALLQKISSEDMVIHAQFGELKAAALVEKIDEVDQTHIRQIENIIHFMPLNPLFARALYEISEYHQRYQAHLTPAKTLLDIGVGTGLALRHVIHQNPHLDCEGVDVRDLRLPRIDVPLEVYDGYTLPFDTNQFDVSLLFYVIHHCQNPQRVLDEAIRVTRQKLIIIEEFHHPNADTTSLDLTERQSHRALGIPPDLPYQLFNKSEFEQMLRERNLLELEQRLLPSKTTRPVEKYLYVVQRC